MSISSEGGEQGLPKCYNEPEGTSDFPDRRLIYGAVINCQEVGLSGGASGPYSVHAFAAFFITEAMETGFGSDIYVEIVDIIGPGSFGAVEVRDEVQLYR